ncbi:MAG: PDZ domain-containing protein, partial [Caulobacteraceae bacterium]|nr:PDZ domain-containing protein [Caulobacteraceae bacterium]
VLWRKRAEQTVKVQVGELVDTEQVASAAPQPQDKGGKSPDSVSELGLQLSQVTPALKEKYGLADDANGVVVTDVANSSAAGERGVKAGDVIVEVAQEEVKTPADIAAKIKAARSAGKKSVLLLVDQKGDLRFVAVKLDDAAGVGGTGVSK